MKIGITTGSFRYSDKPFEYVVDFAKANDIRYLEVHALDGICYFPGLNVCPFVSLNLDPLKVRRIASEKGVEISHLNAGFPLNSPEGAAFGVAFVQRAIRFAKEVGASGVVITDGPFLRQGMSEEEMLQIIKHNVGLILQFAQTHEITVSFKPSSPLSTTVSGIRNILSFSEEKYFGIDFDMGNLLESTDLILFLSAVFDRITHVTCKSFAYESKHERIRGLAISSALGENPNSDSIKTCIQILKRREWDGILFLDTQGEETMKKSIDWIKSIMR